MINNKKSRNARGAIAAAVQRLYDKSAPLLICECLLFGVIGVLMLIRPMEWLALLTAAMGIALLLFGLYRTIAGFVMSGNVGGGWVDVMFGLINVVLGLLFCLFPINAALSVIYMFIILFFINGLRALVFAVNMMRARFGHYIWNFIVALILIAGAVFLMFFPRVGALTVIYYVAISLLVYAISDLYIFVELYRLKRHVMD